MSVPIRFECTDKYGWAFVSPWPLTAKAMDRACQKAFAFYSQLQRDFRSSGRPEDAEAVEKALRILLTNRVKNVVDQSMIPALGLQDADREQEINFPGVPRD